MEAEVNARHVSIRRRFGFVAATMMVGKFLPQDSHSARYNPRAAFAFKAGAGVASKEDGMSGRPLRLSAGQGVAAPGARTVARCSTSRSR